MAGSAGLLEECQASVADLDRAASSYPATGPRRACAQRSWLELTEAPQGSLSGGIGWQGLEMTVRNRAPG